MALFDWFTKAKDAKQKAEDAEKQKDKESRESAGEKAYENSKGKAAKEAWAALNE